MNNVTTTRERLILSSSVNSNLIQLQSSCNIVYASMNDYVFGKSNQTFLVRQNNDVYLSLSSNLTSLNSDTLVSKSLTVTSNVQVGGNVGVSGRFQAFTVQSSNLLVNCNDPITGTTPFIRAFKNNAQEALALLPDGTFRISGPVGIGTQTPREALHVQGNIFSSSNVTSTTVIASSIQGLGTSQFIRFQDKLRLVADNVEVAGNLSITGNLAFDRDLSLVNLIAQEGVFGKRAYFYNNDPFIPMLEMVYDGVLGQTYETSNIVTDEELGTTTSNFSTATCNVYNLIDYRFHPLTSNVSTIAMDTFGRVGLGTRTPDGVLDITHQDGVHKTDNLLKIHGVNDSTTVITKNSCLGIGTSIVNHCLHIDPPDTMSMNPSLVGLYGHDVPFLAAFSNQQTVFHIDQRGGLTINKAQPWGTYLLDVEGGDTRLSTIETQNIRGYSGNCNIDFQQSTLSNIQLLSACNIYVDEHTSHAIHTNFVYSSNISVVGFKCFSWSNMFSISLSNFWLSGAGTLMAESESELQTNHRQEGKLKIVVPTLPSEISRAIYAKGQYSTSIRVHSTDNSTGYPYLELSKGDSYTGQIFLDTDGSMGFRNVGDDDPRLKIVNDPTNNIIQFYSDTISKNGDIGIHVLNGPEYPLDVIGSTRIRNLDLDPVFFVDTGTSGNRRKFIGVATATPAYNMHVEGDFYASLPSRFNSNLTVGGRVGIGTTNVGTAFASVSSPSTFAGPTFLINSQGSGDVLSFANTTSNVMIIKNSGFVGIGTTLPSFNLHVAGDLNFDGSLYEKGSKYISSQWTSLPNADLFFTSNVGIGTTVPNYQLHVHGTSYISSIASFGSNISSEGTVYAKGSFVSTSDKNLKTNLRPITNAMEKISSISGYTYDRTDTLRHECGLVAQEVMNILPEVVSKDESDMYTIAYGNMAGLFVQAFKELQKEIQDLKAEVAFLKGKLA